MLKKTLVILTFGKSTKFQPNEKKSTNLSHFVMTENLTIKKLDKLTKFV